MNVFKCQNRIKLLGYAGESAPQKVFGKINMTLRLNCALHSKKQAWRNFPCFLTIGIMMQKLLYSSVIKLTIIFHFCKDLDHTSDVQIHSWGDSLEEAFELAALAMFGYMTDIDAVEINQEEDVTAEGHDIESLLFNFLDEVLFLFCAEPFLTCKEIKIVELDRENFKITAKCRGEPFDLGKHPQGTEIKAITYSNLQIYDDEDKHEIYVIVDI